MIIIGEMGMLATLSEILSLISKFQTNMTTTFEIYGQTITRWVDYYFFGLLSLVHWVS